MMSTMIKGKVISILIFYVDCHIVSIDSLATVVMPPTLKKLKGHTALGLSVLASVHSKFKIGF